MRLRKTPLALGVLAAALLSSGAAYAVVTTAHTTRDTSPASLSVASTSGPAIYLEADLNGRNEAYSRGMAAGDPRGSAVEILRIKGNQLTFEITWQNLASPTAMHVMSGSSSSAGPVAIPLLSGALPGTINTIEGMVTISNARLLALLLTAPDRYYANLFNGEYPKGAVRGQFRKIGPVDFNRILHIGQFEAVGSGDQEVPGPGPANGDLNAHTVTVVGVSGSSINYATTWSGVNAPLAENINRGAVGANGELIANLFTAPRGLSPVIFAVAGTVGKVPAAVLAAMRSGAGNFHTNLITARFPFGAARGQFFALMSPVTTTMPTTTTKPTTTTTKPATPTMTMPSTSAAMAPPMTSGSIPTDPGNHW